MRKTHCISKIAQKFTKKILRKRFSHFVETLSEILTLKFFIADIKTEIIPKEIERWESSWGLVWHFQEFTVISKIIKPLLKPFLLLLFDFFEIFRIGVLFIFLLFCYRTNINCEICFKLVRVKICRNWFCCFEFVEKSYFFV